MAGNFHWWDPAVSRLSGLQAAALDFRGHGESDWDPDGAYTPERFLEDIDSARASLGWDRFFLVGHSMGARVAVAYAERNPDRVLKLAAVDFLTQPKPRRAARYAASAKVRQPVYSDKEEMLRRFHLEPPGTLLDEAGLRRIGETCIKETPGGFTWRFDWRAFSLPYPPIWPPAPRIACPTLIVRGEMSSVMSRAELERVVEMLPGARGVEIPRAHHHVPLDAPQELAAELDRFL